MTNVETLNIGKRLSVALALAPAFRDKFDFSEPAHYAAWTDMAFKGADALVVKADALQAEAQAKDDAAAERARKDAELAAAKAKEAQA